MNDDSSRPNPNRLPSVLTSDVHNEAELIFSILEDKDRRTVSYLDILTLLRGMGMNPVNTDMDYLRNVMAEPIEKLEAAYREEEARKEKERLREEAAKGKRDAYRKPPPKKGGAGGKDAAQADGKDGAKEEDKKKVNSQPQEEVKNIDWNIFINSVEPIFRDNHQEQEEILDALKVFDDNGLGRITRSELIDLVTKNGESVLSPAEVKAVMELFPEELDFVEFAQRVQGTYVPPTQAEIEAKEAKERADREERLRREREAAAAADPLAALLQSPADGSPVDGAGSPAAE